MTETIAGPGARTVTHHWVTAAAVRTLDLAGIARDTSSARHPQGQEAPRQIIPVASVFSDEDALKQAFLGTMNELATAGAGHGTPRSAIDNVQLTVEIWERGHQVPMAASPSDFVGWCFLHATSPKHKDSGAVAVSDPRAGSAMTAMPGLPWGRQLTITAAQGILAVVPGWLTLSVRPLEEGQRVIVVVATSTP